MAVKKNPKEKTTATKTSFGKKVKGKGKKSYSKYEEKPKKYRGQGKR
jgi:hypothetical protein